MKTADLTRIAGTDEVVLTETSERGQQFGTVIKTGAQRYTQDYDERHDGVLILLTNREGVPYNRPLVAKGPQRLPEHGYSVSWPERKRRQRVNAHNGRCVVDDFGNEVRIATGETYVVAPVQVKTTVTEQKAEQRKRIAEAEAAKARQDAQHEADRKARRFPLAHLRDIAGVTLADAVDQRAYNAARLVEFIDAIESAEVAEVQPGVFSVTMLLPDGYSRGEVNTVESLWLVLAADVAADRSLHRFTNLNRGVESSERPLHSTESAVLAMAALSVHADA